MRRIIALTAALLACAAIVTSAYLYAQTPQGAAQQLPGNSLSVLLQPTETPIGRLAAGQPVPFPHLAGTRMPHSFFPLVDGHANLECTACHTEGDYEGIESTCVACHGDTDPHGGENGTTCNACHSPTDWLLVDFDHSVVDTTDCAGCHTPPADHFPGDCINCHQDTDTFQRINFNHAAIDATDCAACHVSPRNIIPVNVSTAIRTRRHFK